MGDIEDEDFIELSDFVHEMTAVDYYLTEQFKDENIALIVEQIEMETACQLAVNVNENNQVQIGVIPPMYYVETTFMPVFHNIKLNIEIER